jgi:hypothetical protein
VLHAVIELARLIVDSVVWLVDLIRPIREWRRRRRWKREEPSRADPG